MTAAAAGLGRRSLRVQVGPHQPEYPQRRVWRQQRWVALRRLLAPRPDPTVDRQQQPRRAQGGVHSPLARAPPAFSAAGHGVTAAARSVAPCSGPTSIFDGGRDDGGGERHSLAPGSYAPPASSTVTAGGAAAAAAARGARSLLARALPAFSTAGVTTAAVRGVHSPLALAPPAS
jgi:hypothetical protein